MAGDKIPLRQGILRFEEERAEELEAVLSERRPLNRGSVVRRERVCGHAQCRCVTQKQLHVSAYLSVPVKGRTRSLHLPKGDEQRVREATERYRKFRQARMRLVRLGAKQLEHGVVGLDLVLDPRQLAFLLDLDGLLPEERTHQVDRDDAIDLAP